MSSLGENLYEWFRFVSLLEEENKWAEKRVGRKKAEKRARVAGSRFEVHFSAT